jgi:hypothetical protein
MIREGGDDKREDRGCTYYSAASLVTVLDRSVKACDLRKIILFLRNGSMDC